MNLTLLDKLKQIQHFLAIVVVTILLLEGISYLILVLHKGQKGQEDGLLIFEKTTRDGSIQVDNQSVLPVKKNISIEWKSNEFDVSVRTNNRGMREPFNVEDEDIDVAFLGDSFAFGHGVEWYERYTAVFAASEYFSKSKVVSFSYINGFQPEHYEYFLRVRSELRPKHVIIGLYLGNDLGADVLETNYDPLTNRLTLPYRRILDNGGMANNPMVYRFPFNCLVGRSQFITLLARVVGVTRYRNFLFAKRYAIANQPNSTELETGAVDLTQNRAILSLRRIERIVEDRGGLLTVLIIAQNYFFGTENPHINNELRNHIPEVIEGPNIYEAVKKVCTVLGLDYYDPTNILNSKDYFEGDAHWNASGHGKVGKGLADHVAGKKQRKANS